MLLSTARPRPTDSGSRWLRWATSGVTDSADVIVGAGNNDAGGMSAGRAYLIDFNRYVLTSPNGGESWMANHVQTVSWRGAEPADLFISLDNGATESLLASGVGGLASNSVGVTAPNLITDLARIRVAPTDV